MQLNEYLNFRFNAVFEDKYNKLAVLEIKENFDKYKDHLRFEKEDLEKILATNNFEGYYDGDDFDLEPSVEEGLMLLRAFIMAFIKENKNKIPKLLSVELGKGFLKDNNTSLVKNAFLNYNGYKSLYISSRDVIISEKFFREVNDYTQATEERRIYFHNDNKDILKNVAKTALETELQYCYNQTMFENKFLGYSHINLVPSHTYHHYIYNFGKNIIPIYTTDLGFDPFGLTRLEMQKAVIDQYQDNEIYKDIMC